MASDNHVLIKDIVIDKDSIIILFDVNASENVKIEAWLENKNKYKPHILNIYVDNETQSIIIENQVLNAFINTFSNESFKLSEPSWFYRRQVCLSQAA